MADETEIIELPCDYDQYARLLMCIEEEDFYEWNNWRENNPSDEIILGGATFINAVFSATGLKLLFPKNANPNLSGAYLAWAVFQEADLSDVDLHEAKFIGADLRGASLKTAKLQKASLHGARLNGADFKGARLNGVSFNESHMEGAKLHFAQVDSETYLVNCTFDKETDFTGTGLDKAGIDPGLKAAFKNNMRRIHWQNWFCKGNIVVKGLKNILVRPFWSITGYGSSTIRIIFWFMGLALGFAALYFGLENNGSGIVNDLSVNSMPWYHTLLRAIYFSVVTMTTLGFGDLYALKTSYWGHILLMAQVILGYMLLGALVTRLGILFTSEAPATKPTPVKTKKNDD